MVHVKTHCNSEDILEYARNSQTVVLGRTILHNLGPKLYEKCL